MLKTYATDKQIRWTGKAWEIRYALRRAARQKGGNPRLADWLPASLSSSSSSSSSSSADAGKAAPDPSSIWKE